LTPTCDATLILFKVFRHCPVVLMWQFRRARLTTSRRAAPVPRAFDCAGILQPSDTVTARSSCTSCSTTTDETLPTTGRPTPQTHPSSSTDYDRRPTTSFISERTRVREPDRGAANCLFVRPTCYVSVVFAFCHVKQFITTWFNGAIIIRCILPTSVV